MRDAFVGFSAGFEGVVRWMYLDVLGLVTVGIGNLIDPLPAVLPPFRRADGELATRDEIVAEWRRVKVHPTAARQGYRVLEHVTTLRLDDDGIAQVVGGRLSLNDTYLAKRFRCVRHDDCRDVPALGEVCDAYSYNAWPADAQLATLSMAWACGPAFRFPRLEAALLGGSFDVAANECKMNEAGNPGLKPRNAANRTLYQNAARVVAQGLDPEVLYFPTALPAEIA